MSLGPNRVACGFRLYLHESSKTQQESFAGLFLAPRLRSHKSAAKANLHSLFARARRTVSRANCHRRDTIVASFTANSQKPQGSLSFSKLAMLLRTIEVRPYARGFDSNLALRSVPTASSLPPALAEPVLTPEPCVEPDGTSSCCHTQHLFGCSFLQRTHGSSV